MGVSAAAQARIISFIRYEDHLAESWFWTHSPCAWRGRVRLWFREFPYRRLQPAGSLIDPDRMEWWLRQMRRGRHIPPLVACPAEHGRLYLHDGNHRYAAMRTFFAPRPEQARVRVVLLLARGGYAFLYRWFGNYGTYVLMPLPPHEEARFAVLAAAGLYRSDPSPEYLQ